MPRMPLSYSIGTVALSSTSTGWTSVDRRPLRRTGLPNRILRENGELFRGMRL